MHPQRQFNGNAATDSHLPSTVLLLHGFAGFPIQNWPLVYMLRKSGYQPANMGYDSWGSSLEEISQRLAPRLEQIGERCPAGGLHIICHSMGGLVARALIHQHRPQALGHVVMLGTPNAGSEIADMLERHSLLRPILGKARPALVTNRTKEIEKLLGNVDYSVGIIAGSRAATQFGLSRLLPTPNDGKVSVESTRLREAADHICVPLPHILLPYHPTVHRQIVHFLAHGHFQHAKPR